MPHVDEFIHTFAGEETLSLLRCMAVANGTAALDAAALSPIDDRHYLNAADDRLIIAPLSTIGEMRRAIADGKIDKDGHLLCSNRAFVLYCYDRRMFLPLNKPDWAPVDRRLTSSQGKTLTADTLAKVAHQLRKEEYLDDAVRYGDEHFSDAQ